MSNFKAGDKVKLKSGLCCINLNHIDIYTVRKSNADAVALVGIEYAYAAHVFRLYGESKNEELEVLTPLQVVEAILEGGDIQMKYAEVGWKDVDTKDLTVTFIAMNIFRRKPKTVIINGVEVAAPAELPVGTKVWYPSVACKGLQKGIAGGGLSIYWLKEEDAQKALNAMLIPFKQ